MPGPVQGARTNLGCRAKPRMLPSYFCNSMCYALLLESNRSTLVYIYICIYLYLFIYFYLFFLFDFVANDFAVIVIGVVTAGVAVIVVLPSSSFVFVCLFFFAADGTPTLFALGSKHLLPLPVRRLAWGAGVSAGVCCCNSFVPEGL